VLQGHKLPIFLSLSFSLSLSPFVPSLALCERQPQRPVGYVWSQLFGAEELSGESETLADM